MGLDAEDGRVGQGKVMFRFEIENCATLIFTRGYLGHSEGGANPLLTCLTSGDF